jgi:ketol-acid reductoisomerase
MKLIADLVYENGFGDMFARISDTAEYGGYLTGSKIITQETRTAMRECLNAIEDGSFAKSWVDEYRSGNHQLLAMRKEHAHGLEETVGAEVRSLFTQSEGKAL